MNYFRQHGPYIEIQARVVGLPKRFSMVSYTVLSTEIALPGGHFEPISRIESDVGFL